MIKNDPGDDNGTENHRFVGEGDLVAHRLTVHEVHRTSTMPLLQDIPPTRREVHWTHIHIWRVLKGQLVELLACLNGVGLLAQMGAWPRM